MPNRLSKELSPYLLQHAYNPVDWYPFGDEAFTEAKRRNCPVIISIGYSACHWCHVMEHESFSQQSIADVMNRHFVCIKVDREERPDVDQIYVNAVQLLHGQAGWPLNCFALPDGRPFWGGTYFRPEQWIEVLEHLSGLYHQNNIEITEQAERIHQGIKSMSVIEIPTEETELNTKVIEDAYRQLSLRFDTSNGGMKGAPKFPMPSIWKFVLVYHYLSQSGNAIDQVKLTLEKMAMGGIFDQLAGGFARYSTDILWKVPHFEKMLYDNAQLSIVYTDLYKTTGNRFFIDILNSVLNFVQSEFTSPEGAFYSALDADSEGEEGRFYLWEKHEIVELLPEYGGLLSRYWGIDKQGLWENNRNILVRPYEDDHFAMNEHLSSEELRQLVQMASKVLLKYRNQRPRPSLDDKVIVSWNALMIKAFAHAATIAQSKEWTKSALNAAKFIDEHLITADGHIKRAWKNGIAKINGFLDDYAFMADAYLELYQLTYDEYWLFRSKKLCDIVLSEFSQEDSPMFWYLPKTNEDQNVNNISRILETSDGVEPSGNSVMAAVLLALGNLFEDDSMIERSKLMCSYMLKNIVAYPSYYAEWASVLSAHVNGYNVVAISGPDALEYAKKVKSLYHPLTIVTASNQRSEIPTLKEKFSVSQTLIYKCVNHVCSAPVTKIEDLIL